MQHSGWEKVEAFSRDIAIAMAQATSSRDYQPIGVRCREALIALADTVHDPARHAPPAGTEPSRPDADERLNAYFSAELRGPAGGAPSSEGGTRPRERRTA